MIFRIITGIVKICYNIFKGIFTIFMKIIGYSKTTLMFITTALRKENEGRLFRKKWIQRHKKLMRINDEI